MDVAGAVIDLDGTVYRGSEAITGAAETIASLRDRGIDLLFVTNNPTRSPEQYVDRLAEIGVEASTEEILPAGTVTAEYLADHHPDDDVFVVGSSGLRGQLEAAGIHPIGEPEEADIVVTSHTYAFDYDDLTQGLWALDDADYFYGTDPDRVYPDADGKRYPGSGAITGAVAHVAQREPDLILGKPSGVMVELAMEALDCQPSAAIVVGDGLDTDVVFGARAGMTTVLVLTGRTSRADLANGAPAPDHVVGSIGDVLDLI